MGDPLCFNYFIMYFIEVKLFFNLRTLSCFLVVVLLALIVVLFSDVLLECIFS